MKENAFKTFVQETYTASSPIPYIITVQVALFILIHIFALISSQANSSIDLYAITLSELSLPDTFNKWLLQPWSLFTYPFVYTSLFELIFDCLWLSWIGNMFLNLLKPKHLIFTLLGGVLIGGLTFLSLNSYSIFSIQSPSYNTISFGLASLLASMMILTPTAEVRLIIFGNVRFRTIAIVYFIIEIVLLANNKQYAAAIAFATAILFGILFIQSLSKGNDWSQIIGKKKTHLKVVSRQYENNVFHKHDLPNQDLIDQVLDKISEKGYDNLSRDEKEILFRASKNKE